MMKIINAAYDVLKNYAGEIESEDAPAEEAPAEKAAE